MLIKIDAPRRGPALMALSQRNSVEPSRLSGDTCVKSQTAQTTACSLQLLYRNREWFDLRDAVHNIGQQGFYRAAIACTFNEYPQCLDYLLPIIKSAPNSQTTYHAHELLSWTYLRRGQFRSALVHIEAMLALRPFREDLRATWALLSALRQYPEQSTSHLESSALPFEMVEGNMFIPVAINKVPANFMVDSGATISMITRSEARRLGLQIEEIGPNAAKIYGATGAGTGFQIAMGSQLNVGKCRFTNVTFLVLDDQQLQFPAGYAGALGLPVLIGLGTLSWNAAGQLDAGFSGLPPDTKHANVCFDGPEPVTLATFREQKLPLVLDTGNGMTIFSPAFAGSFTDFVSTSGRKSTVFLNGISGGAQVDSVCLPRVTFRLDNFEFVVRPAHVLLRTTTSNSNRLCGRLGMDCLNQAGRVTLDFKCMKLTLQS